MKQLNPHLFVAKAGTDVFLKEVRERPVSQIVDEPCELHTENIVGTRITRGTAIEDDGQRLRSDGTHPANVRGEYGWRTDTRMHTHRAAVCRRDGKTPVWNSKGRLAELVDLTVHTVGDATSVHVFEFICSGWVGLSILTQMFPSVHVGRSMFFCLRGVKRMSVYCVLLLFASAAAEPPLPPGARYADTVAVTAYLLKSLLSEFSPYYQNRYKTRFTDAIGSIPHDIPR